MENNLTNINYNHYHNIVILTGAGISVASGIRPFRGENGLWEEINPLEYVTASALETNPLAVWQFHSSLRQQLTSIQPNIAHLKLAEFEAQLSPRQTFTLITQNVDHLHQNAGSRNVIEIHGTIYRTRCSNSLCSLEPFMDRAIYEELPTCNLCGSVLRPDTVLFDEPLPVYEEWLVKKALRDCDLFMAIGTSGMVSPASNYVRSADYAGARTILINLEPMEPKNPYFHEEYLGRAEELIPLLFATR
ncbi:MAG: SIR2 family NAD-dependent protein deacylase [Microcystaceae cyanobacterium]